LEQDLTAQDEERPRTPVQRKGQELRTRASNISCKDLEERLEVALTVASEWHFKIEGGIRDFEMMLEETKMQAPEPWMNIDQVRACRARR
jgi:hypothetical protein